MTSLAAPLPSLAPPADAADLRVAAAVLALLGRIDGVNPPIAPVEEQKRLHVGYAEAAERLNLPEKWLRERINRLPHRKFGKFVQFTEKDLQAISDMHFVEPPAKSSSVHAVKELRPAHRSRSRT